MNMYVFDVILMYLTAFVVVIVILILIAEYLSRDKRVKHHTDSSYTLGRESSSQKLAHSKTDDSSFFDGESEDYTDARQRIRQHY